MALCEHFDRFSSADTQQKLLRSLLRRHTVVGVHFLLDGSSSERRLTTVTIVWPPGSFSPPWIIHQDFIGPALFVALLETLFLHSKAVKVVHNILEAAYWLSTHGFRVDERVRNVVDLQLFYELVVAPDVRNASLETIVAHCNVHASTSSHREALRRQVQQDPQSWSESIDSLQRIERAVECAQLSIACFEQGVSTQCSPEIRTLLFEYTARRWQFALPNDGHAMIWFDPAKNYQARSVECLATSVLQLKRIAPALEFECDLAPLLAVLPSRFQDAVMAIQDFEQDVAMLCLDVGRLPHAYTVTNRRVLLTPQPSSRIPAKLARRAVVTAEEVSDVVKMLGGEGHVQDDNRIGVDRQLHRISVMRSKTQEIYGLTLRVGRTLMHASNMLLDLLLSEEHRQKSVLFLGRPGSGKTTMIRDVTRCISESGENVCIIDTSNEIGGDGLVPHPCIGWARRMMVRSLDEQASVMVECVQNHTVETLVVDEIGRKNEVLAAGTVRQRGPRLIASAHGDFRSLIRNSDLKGLIGGVQSVTVGDAEAKKKPGLGKVQSQRSGAPIFDVIVELDEVCRGRCRIIWNVANAVDDVLSGQPYAYETREQSTKFRGIRSP
ncbi:hypothetical protein Poli38472_012741 [Pythium oligandrum]|uniref:AAA+ ATPase domain-containing protein n=1 Tax=Pythium oligandrum TaxID=41045 RepID=A0A8K1CEX0_PYTOL|nr:hypothetical protein Poli38472_012741 [Pythium oligandrum]|eukprot:TMW61550.1 hypothetical protein Poli38472_012741 [Pythium oligandrum]